MSDSVEELLVSVSFRDTTVEFKGNPESVAISVNDFLLKQIPNLDLARKVSINYSAAELINTFLDYVRITPEGPRVWKGDKKMSDREIISLQLLASKIAHQTGKRRDAVMNLSEIQSVTGINPKSISSRLSEILKLGYVEKYSSEQGVSYRLTTQGIHWLEQALMKKVR